MHPRKVDNAVTISACPVRHAGQQGYGDVNGAESDTMHLGPDNDFPAPGYSLDLVRDLREHLLWLRLKGRSDRTLACRRRALVRLAEHLGRDPWDATYDNLYRWQVSLVATSLEHMRWHTALIRPYYGWLHNRGVRPDNPAALLPTPKARRGLPRPISEDHLMAAIVEAPPRLLPWLLLGAWCGLRALEVAGMERQHLHIDERGQGWCTVKGKGGHIRDVPIPAWVWPHILDAAAERGPCWRRVDQPHQAITPRLVSQYCSDYLRARGLDDRFHSLRHRAGTMVLEAAEGDIRLVQDFLGHASIKTTQVYTLVRPRRVAAAVGQLPAPAALPHPTSHRRHLHVVGHGEGHTA